MTEYEKKQLDTISTLLKKAGYDPYAQLSGYLQTGEDTYITRYGNARQKIALIKKKVIDEYVKAIQKG